MIFDHGKFEMPDKALFIGNSLLLGNGAFGMNATDSTSDYHAVIQRKFLKANPAYTDTKLSGVDFEACENRAQQMDWLDNRLCPVLRDDLDLVVIQIGDNVNTSRKREGTKSPDFTFFEKSGSNDSKACPFISSRFGSSRYCDAMIWSVSRSL